MSGAHPVVALLSGAAGNNLLKSLGSQVGMLGVAVWMSHAAPLPLLLLSMTIETEVSLRGLVADVTWLTIGDEAGGRGRNEDKATYQLPPYFVLARR
ncbi:MAG: hypothetical protein R3F54_25125 [Alphaproteobacteria bacterium]